MDLTNLMSDNRNSVFVGVATPTYFAPQGACRAQNNGVLRHAELVSASINANVKKQESGSKSKALLNDNSHTSRPLAFQTSKSAPTLTLPRREGTCHCEEERSDDVAIQLINNHESGNKNKALLNDNIHTSIHPALQTSESAPTLTLPQKGGKRAAFTLAEVLITLGIIGVVAALTLPTLIQQHRKSVVETKLARFYSTINQAVKMAEVEHGDSAYWDDIGRSCELKDEEAEIPECADGTSTALLWYNKYLAKYIKSDKIGLMVLGEDNVSALIYFPDGTVTAMTGNGWNFYISEKALFNRRSNPEFGIDAFPFSFVKGKGLTLNKYFVNGEDCMVGARGVSCTGVIMQNGWKIPDDYPFKF